MFAYCCNNPVTREDSDGEAFDTVFDLISLGSSIYDVFCNPYNPWAWAGLAGDVIDVAVPFVTGVGEVTRAAKVAIETAEAVDDAHDAMKAVSDMVDVLPGACFIAGTLVSVEDGHKAIEDVETGDYVWAWDEETGEVALKQVVETYVRKSDELIYIFVNGEEIITTPDHPFYAPVKGWTNAVNLRAGDILVLVNGEYVIVEKVQHEILEAPVTVYNFQVEDFHTYFVGHDGVLVHNDCALGVLDDSALVVRGGMSTPENLMVNQLKDVRGHISANSANGVSLEELATTPKPFKNGQISVTTVGEIRRAGMDVIPDGNGNNIFHASIVPRTYPLLDEEAAILSGLFKRLANIWRE